MQPTAAKNKVCWYAEDLCCGLHQLVSSLIQESFIYSPHNGIGPHVFRMFENGHMEEYFESTILPCKYLLGNTILCLQYHIVQLSIKNFNSKWCHRTLALGCCIICQCYEPIASIEPGGSPGLVTQTPYAYSYSWPTFVLTHQTPVSFVDPGITPRPFWQYSASGPCSFSATLPYPYHMCSPTQPNPMNHYQSPGPGPSAHGHIYILYSCLSCIRATT